MVHIVAGTFSSSFLAVGLLGQKVRHYNFVTYCRIPLWKDYTSLHFNQQYGSMSVSLQLCQQNVYSYFLIFASLIDENSI